MSMYSNMHREFALRTRENINTVDALKASGDINIHEVTHLINSLLGTIIFLKEWKYINSMPTNAFCKNLQLEILKDTRSSCADIRDLLRRIRNALAHGHIEAYGKENIEGIKLWDGPKDQPPNWGICIDIANIKTLANSLVSYVIAETSQMTKKISINNTLNTQ